MRAAEPARNPPPAAGAAYPLPITGGGNFDRAAQPFSTRPAAVRCEGPARYPGYSEAWRPARSRLAPEVRAGGVRAVVAATSVASSHHPSIDHEAKSEGPRGLVIRGAP